MWIKFSAFVSSIKGTDSMFKKRSMVLLELIRVIFKFVTLMVEFDEISLSRILMLFSCNTNDESVWDDCFFYIHSSSMRALCILQFFSRNLFLFGNVPFRKGKEDIFCGP